MLLSGGYGYEPQLGPFWRSSIGFDRLIDLMDESLRYQPENNYPPYNIERTGENAYRISLAVAGFKPDQISVTVEQNTLVVTGREVKKERARLPPSRHRGTRLRASL